MNTHSICGKHCIGPSWSDEELRRDSWAEKQRWRALSTCTGRWLGFDVLRVFFWVRLRYFSSSLWIHSFLIPSREQRRKRAGWVTMICRLASNKSSPSFFQAFTAFFSHPYLRQNTSWCDKRCNVDDFERWFDRFHQNGSVHLSRQSSDTFLSTKNNKGTFFYRVA